MYLAVPNSLLQLYRVPTTTVLSSLHRFLPYATRGGGERDNREGEKETLPDIANSSHLLSDINQVPSWRLKDSIMFYS
jgi:hypothetical protein